MKKFFLLFITFLLEATITQAQHTECADNDDCPDVKWKSTSYSIGISQCWYKVTYVYSICGDDIQIAFGDVHLDVPPECLDTDPRGHFETLQIEEFSNVMLLMYAEIRVLENLYRIDDEKVGARL